MSNIEMISKEFDSPEEYEIWRSQPENIDWWLDYEGYNDQGKYVVDLSRSESL